jgi:hypothetical protein
VFDDERKEFHVTPPAPLKVPHRIVIRKQSTLGHRTKMLHLAVKEGPSEIVMKLHKSNTCGPQENLFRLSALQKQVSREAKEMSAQQCNAGGVIPSPDTDTGKMFRTYEKAQSVQWAG